MDIKEKFKNFYANLNKLLKPHGFESNMTTQESVRGDEWNWQRIKYITNKMYDFTYSIDCQFLIRNNVIQKIRGQTKDKRGRSGAFTILEIPSFLCVREYKQASNWEKNKDVRGNLGNVVNFEDASSVDNWFIGFEKFMEEAGYDFLNRFRSFQDYDEWFNSMLVEQPEHSLKSLPWNDSCVGLIAAKLNYNPSYEKVFVVWESHFRKGGDNEALMELQNLKTFLDKNSVEDLLLISKSNP